MDDEQRVQEAQDWLDYFTTLFYDLKEHHKTHASYTEISGWKTGRKRTFSIYELSELIVMCRCILGEKSIENYLDLDYIRAVSKVY